MNHPPHAGQDNRPDGIRIGKKDKRAARSIAISVRTWTAILTVDVNIACSARLSVVWGISSNTTQP